MDEKKVRTEEFEVTGEKLVEKVKELIHAGNVRRIIVKNESGKALIEIPMNLGVAAALGTIAALVAKLTVAVEKVED